MTTWDELPLKDGTYLCKEDCLLKVIDLDPRNSVAYTNLGGFIERSITLSNGTVMTDPRDSCAYYNLGFNMSADERVTLRNGTVLTGRGCCLAAIDCDPHDSRPYHNLACILSDDEKVTLRNGTVITRKECHRRPKRSVDQCAANMRW